MAKEHRVRNRLAEVRKSRGIAAAELARRTGVIRQTIYAIEAGTYLPNTELALLLAQALEVGVDQLFSLASGPPPAPEAVAARMLSAARTAPGQPVRVCRIGQRQQERWVGIPVSAAPYFIPEADGVVTKAKADGTAQLAVFGKAEAGEKRLILAGCDPATSLVSRMVERATGVEIVSAGASSRLALAWLKEGAVHIAGSHLEDPQTGEFNLPFVRREFPRGDMLVVTFARWEEGFVVAPGNPKSIRQAEDLGRPGVRFVNREPGSGSRALFDKLTAAAGMEAGNVRGHDRIAHGHLAAAYAVLAGEADTCLATRSAAEAFQLGFEPVHSARYDLVMRSEVAELPAVQAFLEVLQRATLRRKLEVLAGYDTSETGTRLAA